MEDEDAAEGPGFLWEQRLDNYCERFGDADFWAEPLNAVTNAGFIVAGVWLVLTLLRDAQHGDRPRDPLSWTMTALILAIGVGSFLFHTVATGWALIADVVPILLFMLVAMFAIARRGFGAPLWAAGLAVIGFIALRFGLSALGAAALGVGEDAVLVERWRGAVQGAIGYSGALLVLLVVGPLMMRLEDAQRRAAGARLLSAGIVFAASLAFRTVDKPLCDVFTIGDLRLGTHFLWHTLNSLVLYLVASALIGLSPRRRSRPPRGAPAAA